MDDASEVATAEILVRLSRADWKYTDLYLRLAERALAARCTREQFRGLTGRHALLGALAHTLRRAVQQGDWSETGKLAAEGAELRTQIQGSQSLVEVAGAVYGKRSLDPSATALALSGTVSRPAAVLEREIARLTRDLRSLADRDAGERGFYERRAGELERMVLDLPVHPPPRVDPSELRDAALVAVDAADFAEVLRVARSAAQSGTDRLGRIRAPLPVSGWIERLEEPLPKAALERAPRLGLAEEELEANAAFNGYLSCGCADRADFPALPLGAAHTAPEVHRCGHVCPPQVGGVLKENLDTLMAHPFLTSGGTRYLPWFGAERMLVESFPENEPDARTPLLESLSLPRRQGLTRLEIEDALLFRGPQLCEELGLSATVYRVACIPFDAYKRLADRKGWGKRPLWTQFDGYQLTRDLQLHALVGGDVGFGGADDLCGVGRAYDSSHITARFVVLKRDRFEAREPRS